MSESFTHRKPSIDVGGTRTSKEDIKKIVSAARAAGLSQPVAPKIREWLSAFGQSASPEEARQKIGLSLTVTPEQIKVLLDLITDESVRGDHRLIHALSREFRLYGTERKELIARAEKGAAQVKAREAGEWYEFDSDAHTAREVVALKKELGPADQEVVAVIAQTVLDSYTSGMVARIESPERRHDLAFLVNRLAKIEQRIEPVFDPAAGTENPLHIQQKNTYDRLSGLLRQARDFADNLFSDSHLAELQKKYDTEYRPLFDTLESLRQEKKKVLAELRTSLALDATEKLYNDEKNEFDRLNKKIAEIGLTERTRTVSAEPQLQYSYDRYVYGGSYYSPSSMKKERVAKTVTEQGIEIIATATQQAESALTELESEMKTARMNDIRSTASAIVDCRAILKELNFFGMVDKYGVSAERSQLLGLFEQAILTSLPKNEQKSVFLTGLKNRVKDLLWQLDYVDVVRTEQENHMSAIYKDIQSREYRSENETVAAVFSVFVERFVQQALRDGASLEDIASNKKLLVDYVNDIINEAKITQSYQSQNEPLMKLLLKGPPPISANSRSSFRVLDQKISSEIERKKSYRSGSNSPHTRAIDKEVSVLQSIKEKLGALTTRPGEEGKRSQDRLKKLEHEIRQKENEIGTVQATFSDRYARIEHEYAEVIRVWEDNGMLAELELLEGERTELLQEFKHNINVIERLIKERPLTNGLYLVKTGLIVQGQRLTSIAEHSCSYEGRGFPTIGSYDMSVGELSDVVPKDSETSDKGRLHVVREQLLVAYIINQLQSK